MSEIALRVWDVWIGAAPMNRKPTVATIEAAIAKYRTPASASRAWASWTSIPFRSAAAASCLFSPSASSDPSSAARPRLSHQLTGQYPNFSTSAAERSSEGATRSEPHPGFYAFVPDSQFPQGHGGRGGDEPVEADE